MLSPFLFVFLFIIKTRFPRNKSIADILKNRYNEDVLRIFRKFESISKKLTKAKLDLQFLMVCKAYNYVPKFMRFKLYKASLHNSDFYKSWLSKLLLKEINFKRKLIDKLDEETSTCSSQLRLSLSFIDYKFCLLYTSPSP